MGIRIGNGHPVAHNPDLENTMFRRFVVAGALMLGAALPLQAQQPQELTRQINRSGPRFGFTFLGGTLTDTLRIKRNIDVSSVITQFGWQYEHQFASLEGGPVALNEWVFLVGGLDQNVFLPSLSWIMGVRFPNQFEIGVGPNVTPAGVSLAFSSGMTFKAGALAIPVNIALVPSKFGMRSSILTGFNLYR